MSNFPADQQVRKALAEAKRELLELFPVERIILFGSAARGELEPESDIDLLIVTSDLLDRETRHQITDLIFEINLRYETNLSTVVVDHESWNHGLISALPFREKVEAEGIIL